MATKTSGFACMECGHKYRTIKAAEKASFGPNGCPKCGSSDVDLEVTPTHASKLYDPNQPSQRRND